MPSESILNATEGTRDSKAKTNKLTPQQKNILRSLLINMPGIKPSGIEVLLNLYNAEQQAVNSVLGFYTPGFIYEKVLSYKVLDGLPEIAPINP